MPQRTMMRLGGLALVCGAVAFVGVFSYLAIRFNYPDVLQGQASEVLPQLREGGATMRAVWALYAVLPLLLIPGAVGAWAASPDSRPLMTLALVLAGIASLSMCLGLMRWPSVHWELASAYSGADPAVQAALAVVFDGLNVYLGNYIGEFLGETLLAGFFLLTAFSMQAQRKYPAWMFWGGTAFAAMFFVGALRNIVQDVQWIADVNNVLLPIWMIALGVGMWRYAQD